MNRYGEAAARDFTADEEVPANQDLAPESTSALDPALEIDPALELDPEHDIAIVGIAGRFPGASDLDAFWKNLREGVESISFFSDDELRQLGVDPACLQDPNFVRAAPVLENPESFDAAFFGYSPREASLLDPQQRVFLQCAWQALENSGHEPESFDGLIGVYGGMSLSTYLLFHLLHHPRLDARKDSFELMIGADKDFLTTRVSYHLNLKGPSLDVQTGCSTSLVAVHLACEALHGYQCDMALAGGVSIQVPQRWGYFYEEGGITSPDGHCRAFDAEGSGTLFGSGVGLVVLRRLSDALQDGDRIEAVIKGSAINNDGSTKIGFTAPGVDGQAEVIARAQAVAGVDPHSISYVEAHGTGTALGDPVEVMALEKAFDVETGAPFCGLGSVKTNIGHLDAAAGVAGLIKTILALRHREMPPSLHFEKPNPKIDFERSPFYVVDRLRPWPNGQHPRRAGVSSFGIGGTNAHLVVQEGPPSAPASEEGRAVAESPIEEAAWHLLPLSARDDESLNATTRNLEQFLKTSDEDLADIASTLQTGRKRFAARRVILCQSREDALTALQEQEGERLFSRFDELSERPVAFMFPGGGAQYANMGLELYQRFPVFRREVDRCALLLRRHLGQDIRTWLYPTEDKLEEAKRLMTRTSIALPALFAVEYALAQLWRSWGIEPRAMIGHSLGEYPAACLAGVFSLDDTLALVALRGQLFERLPSGSMVSLPLSEEEARAKLSGLDPSLAIAAINAPGQCVASGTDEALGRLMQRLDADEIEYRRIQIDVAAHSPAVEPILDDFRALLKRINLNAPELPFLSNVTGTWITVEDATDPDYWVRQLRHTVRFGDGVAQLLEDPDLALLEVGPGRNLATLARLQVGQDRQRVLLPSMRHPRDLLADEPFLLATVARLWSAGVPIEWNALHPTGRKRRRLALPTYPFAQQRFWIEPPTGERQAREGKESDLKDWFYLPTWRRTSRPAARLEALAEAGGKWLIFTGLDDVGPAVARALRGRGIEPIEVVPGQGFEERPGGFALDPQDPDHYRQLLACVSEPNDSIHLLHFWSLAAAAEPEDVRFVASQSLGFYSVLHGLQAASARSGRCSFWAVTQQMQRVEHGDRTLPELATLLGPLRVAPQEFEHLSCHGLDLDRTTAGGLTAERLLAEVADALDLEKRETRLLAWRGPWRWQQTYEPCGGALEAPRRLREGGVYLLVGGLGGVGLHLARHLARTVSPRLILAGRSELPERSSWDAWLASRGEEDATSQKIRAVLELESLGATVQVERVDAAREGDLERLVNRAEQQFGRLDGVIYLAGHSGASTVKLLPEIDRQEVERQFAAKVQGLLRLDAALAGKKLDFCLLFSSNVSVLGGLGASAYAAANHFLDAFAQERAGRSEVPWISANWDGWLFEEGGQVAAVQTQLDRYAMEPAESLDAFERLMTGEIDGQIVVSTGKLDHRLDWWRRESEDEAAWSDQVAAQPRPDLGTPFEPPTNEREATVARIWQELLGLDELGIDDNFFDLGGSSLIGLKVISKLKAELGIEIPVVQLFEGPTVRSFVRLLDQSQVAKDYEESANRGARRRARRRQKALREVG